MASEDNKYTSSFKKEVAQKALDQSKKNLDKLSDHYDVPVSVILMWATELEKGGEEVFDSEEEEDESTPGENRTIDMEISDSRVADSIEYGVMLDQLNLKRLVFWSILGTVLVLIFVVALFEINQYNERLIQETTSANSEYYRVNQMKEEAKDQLESFGVVNLENGVYRIPIDSAISEIAADK